jgi:hypothetical protein
MAYCSLHHLLLHRNRTVIGAAAGNVGETGFTKIDICPVIITSFGADRAIVTSMTFTQQVPAAAYRHWPEGSMRLRNTVLIKL